MLGKVYRSLPANGPAQDAVRLPRLLARLTSCLPAGWQAVRNGRPPCKFTSSPTYLYRFVYGWQLPHGDSSFVYWPIAQIIAGVVWWKELWLSEGDRGEGNGVFSAGANREWRLVFTMWEHGLVKRILLYGILLKAPCSCCYNLSAIDQILACFFLFFYGVCLCRSNGIFCCG